MTLSALPTPPTPRPHTALDEIDATVERLASRKDQWIDVALAQRISYLQRCLDGVLAVSERWVTEGCRMKGIAPGDPLEGEEWLVGPWQTIRNIQVLIRALESGGAPKPPKVRTRKDGQQVAQVFPANGREKMIFSGMRGEVWIEPGKPATQGAAYRKPPHAGRVALVLGAGNVTSISPMDALYKLFAESEVVVLKVNPVNAHVGPLLEEAFRALVDDGFFAVVYGGAEVGAHLANHPKIDTLHVTGSDRTYDAIVWGATAEEQARRKASHEPKNSKPFTAELGCVTPVLVVPGPWSAADLDFHAQQVAGMVAQNASFNCNAAKILVTAKGWLQRDAFLRKVHEALANTPPRKAYYPGAQERYAAFLERYPNARAIGGTGTDIVPWTVIPDVPPIKGEYALTHEAFCGVLAEVTLDAADASDFLPKATAFANESCWGTLSITILVHPTTKRAHREALDAAIAGLRYGGIGVNCWSASVYALVTTTWGAFPGHAPEEIQSGSGVVHNGFLFDHPQKSVVYAPFRAWPKPVWFPNHRSLAAVARKLTQLEAYPTWGKVLGVAIEALKA